MLLIRCPVCEMDRPEIEFRYAGEAHITRVEQGNDQEMAEFLYFRTNPKGVLAERWRHIHGCGRYFNALRHTFSDAFLCTYRAGEAKPELGEIPASKAPSREASS
jgi:sarcosine oxidase, subunit delta